MYLASVGFTWFSAPPPLFLRRPGVISMRINVAINHSVPPLPDVIQGLLKTSALCDVYGRREIWAWQPSPKTLAQCPSGTLIQSATTVLDRPKDSSTSSTIDRNNQSQTWPTAVLNFWLILFVKSVKDSPTHILSVVYLCNFLNQNVVNFL